MARKPQRRSPGEGSIYQRKDGRWFGAITIPTHDGKQRRATVSGKTRGIVSEKLKELQAEVDAGVLPDQMTVAVWMDYHLRVVSDNRPSSKQGDWNTYRAWIKDNPIGRIPLRGLREDHVRVWHRQMRDHRGPRTPDGLADASILRIHSVLQAGLSAAVKERKVARNVAANVKPKPRGEVKPHHPQLTPDEARQALDGTTSHRDRARAVVAFAGVEQSAALGLRWEDCPPGLLSVQRTVHRITGQGLVVEEGKAKAAKRIRDVPLGPAFTAIIEAWRVESGGVGWVFPGHNPDNPNDPRRDAEAWKRFLANAGVRHVPLHGARGGGASAMKELPVRVAADVLGHTQARMTTDVYQRSSAAERLEATKAIEASILG